MCDQSIQTGSVSDGQLVVLVPLLHVALLTHNLLDVVISMGSIGVVWGISGVPAFELGQNGLRAEGLQVEQVEGLRHGGAAAGHHKGE